MNKALFLSSEAIRELLRVGTARVTSLAADKIAFGDQFWVRETWAPVDNIIHGYNLEEPVAVGYRADQTALDHSYGGPYPLDTYGWRWEQVKWRSPVTMPQWASRLTVIVKDKLDGEVVLVRSSQ